MLYTVQSLAVLDKLHKVEEGFGEKQVTISESQDTNITGEFHGNN